MSPQVRIVLCAYRKMADPDEETTQDSAPDLVQEDRVIVLFNQIEEVKQKIDMMSRSIAGVLRRLERVEAAQRKADYDRSTERILHLQGIPRQW